MTPLFQLLAKIKAKEEQRNECAKNNEPASAQGAHNGDNISRAGVSRPFGARTDREASLSSSLSSAGLGLGLGLGGRSGGARP